MLPLYFAQAIPYVVAMQLSVIMYKDLGVSNSDIAFYTSLLYLPWVIKPLWSPVVDMFGTKRRWTVLLQLGVAASLVAVGLSLQLPNFFVASLAVMWLMAFSSATHDISADGFYMLGLRQQLDDLADLGVTAIWITPVVKNIDGFVTGAGFATGLFGKAATTRL